MTELRPLSGPERAVLAAVSSRRSSEYRPALSTQIASVLVRDAVSPHMIELVVDDRAPMVPVADGPLPGRTMIVTAGGQPTGEIIIWIQDGMLSALEQAWFTDEPPTRWPEPDELSAV